MANLVSGMLAAFFDIKDATSVGGIKIKDVKLRDANTGTPSKAARLGKRAAAKSKSTKSAPEKVEPYEQGGMHAQFLPSAEGPEPKGMVESCVLECDAVGDVVVDTRDPYEYLWQEADQAAVVEEDDTDSCVTFDDDVSDMSEVMGTSPVDATLDELSTLFTRRKTKVSETPVYSGPQLWYEDDDFID